MYDEVARDSPQLCPLVMAGDLRSGSELLKSARADSLQTIESLVSSRKGRIMLNRLTEHIEAQVLAVEQVLGWSRRSESMEVPRPIPFHMSSIAFDSQSPAIGYCSEQGLVGMCSNWIYNNGYESDGITRVLRTLPPRVHAGLSRLIATMHRCWRAQLVESSGAASSIRCLNSLDMRGSMPRCLTVEEEAIWEAETEVGVMKVEYDPCTQRRTTLAVTSRLASFWCQHREELLMRLAMHEARTGLTEFCGVSLLIAFIAGSMNCEQMFYARLCIPVGDEIRGILVTREEVKRFNSQGQLTQVAPWTASLCKYCQFFPVQHTQTSFIITSNKGRLPGAGSFSAFTWIHMPCLPPPIT